MTYARPIIRSRNLGLPNNITISLFVGLTIIVCFSGAARAASPGALDLSFGVRGTAAFNMGNIFQDSRAVVVQPDGKVILGGWANICSGANCDSSFVVIRFNANGSLDTGFGTGGRVVTDYSGQNESVYALALQSDGKIVAAGGLSGGGGTNIVGFKVVRYMPGGTLDSGFGAAGKVYENFNNVGGTPQSMFIQTDGKIVVAGTDGTSMLFVARFNTNGSVDTTFGTSGRIATNAPNVFDIRMAPSGDKLVVIGSSQPAGTLRLLRFNSDGSPDSGFGTGGTATSVFSASFVPAVAVQSDQKIVVSGANNDQDARIPPLRRFNADGSVDDTFVPNHGQILNGACVICTQRVAKVLLLPDGRFYLSGAYAQLNNVPSVFSVSRYLSNGLIDNSFGFRGTSLFRHTNLSPSAGNNLLWTVWDAALAPDGKIVVTGSGDLPISGFGQEFFLALRINVNVTRPTTRGDLDGDGKTDFAVYRPSDHAWYWLNSADGSFGSQLFGADGDALAPGDYNYDSKTDPAIFRPSSVAWYISPSLPTGGGNGGGPLGQAGDIQVPEDYDGDGYTDLAVFHPASGTWTIRYHSLAWMNPLSVADMTYNWGLGTDRPVPADYDGDGRADLAVFRPSTGDWFVFRSSDGQVVSQHFGLGTDLPVPADYDGDGKADIAVFRAGNWYVLRSSDNNFAGINWGTGTDLPVAGDYDGDGKADIAVFRSSTGEWYVLKSSDSTVLYQYWGVDQDIPIPYAYSH